MQSHSSSYSQCMFLVKIEIAARKIRNHCKICKIYECFLLWMISNIWYTCIALLPCIRKKISFHKLLCTSQIFMKKIFAVQHYPWNNFSIKLFPNYDIYMYQMSSSESWPRKVELTRAHSIKNCDYRESLHITMRPVNNPIEISLTTMIFIS